ncbi:hypothetical protein AB9128_13830, partial [Streptomyces cinereoruber]
MTGSPPKAATSFRDVADDHQRVSEQTLSLDELIVGILTAGIYGRNFEHVPEPTPPHGHPAVWPTMITVCAAAHRALRRDPVTPAPSRAGPGRRPHSPMSRPR